MSREVTEIQEAMALAPAIMEGMKAVSPTPGDAIISLLTTICMIDFETSAQKDNPELMLKRLHAGLDATFRIVGDLYESRKSTIKPATPTEVSSFS